MHPDALLDAIKRAIGEAVRSQVLPAIEAAITRVTNMQSAAAGPAFISVNEAISLLHVSRSQIYRLFADGSLKPVKSGRRTLLHRTDLEAFIERLRQAPTA